MKRVAKEVQRKRKPKIEAVEEVEREEGAVEETSPHSDIGGKIKYAAHCLLVILSRLTDGLTSIYETLFVLDEKVGALDFSKDHGFRAFEKGDYESAVKYFLAANKESAGKDPEILYYLGLSYANQEDYEPALDYLKKSEGFKSDDPDIVAEIGSCLMKLENYEEAVAYLKKAIELTPEVSDHYYSLGTACEKTGKLEDAIVHYKRAIEIDPRDSVYYHALGFAYEAAGKHVDAITCFKKAMELEKGHR